MTHFQTVLYSSILVILILLSAFFSCAETSLMAINRYRLKHRARMKKRSALLILELLKRPDRLLGVILIGNNVCNIFAASLATLLAVNFFGEKWVFFASVLLTIIILVISEVAPKTLAATYPDQTARLAAWPIFFLLKLFYPVVWLINALSNGLLWIFRVKTETQVVEPLSRDELRSIVYEARGKLSHQYQNMMVSILDLNKVLVEDIMVPRHEVVGIDLEWPWNDIVRQIAKSRHSLLPVYRENLNQAAGILYLHELVEYSLMEKDINKDVILDLIKEPYFVPEGTSLNVQLLNFQREHKRMALVVDEYGEIQGLISLEDILEEIVGEFPTNINMSEKRVTPRPDGGYLVEGAITIKELNRLTGLKFPVKGPRTLSGLIIEQLESIPKAGTCLKIGKNPVEIMVVKNNRVKTARLYPPIE